MKKFTKVSLVIAGTFLLLGAIASIIGIAFGGKELLRTAIVNNEFSYGFYGYGWPDWDWDWDYNNGYWDWDWDHNNGYWDDDGDWIGYDNDSDDEDWYNDGGEEYSGEFSGVEIANTAQVDDLEIKIGAAALYIRESQDNVFRIDGDIRGKVKCYVKNGTLVLKSKYKRVHLNHNEKIYLYIPKEMIFDEADIYLGAGEIICNQLKAKVVESQIGAGRFECAGVEAEELKADIGVGHFAVENGMIKKGDFTIGVGEMTYEGEIRGDLEAVCSVGSANFDLREEEQDHNYDINASIGTVQIGSSSYNSLSNDTWIDNNADSTYDLECSMGSITINFK